MRTQYEDLIRSEVDQRLDIRDLNISQFQMLAIFGFEILIRDRELVQPVPYFVVAHNEAISSAAGQPQSRGRLAHHLLGVAWKLLQHLDAGGGGKSCKCH